jgi:hypothetical protein
MVGGQAASGGDLDAVADRLASDAQHHGAAADRDIFEFAPAMHADQGAHRHGRLPTRLLTKPV